MKLNTLHAEQAAKRRQHAFTLIEMIGVLAVIAILAALLIPKVFSAIADAKINNAVVSAETVKTAIADHYGKYGKFDAIFGTNIIAAPVTNYDISVLMYESLMDKPFQAKVGTNWSVLMATCDAVSNAVSAVNHSYNLDGITASGNEAPGQFVMEAIIYGVAQADAQAISLRLDGPTLSAPNGATGDDLLGRVKYADKSGGATDVHIYLTHR